MNIQALPALCAVIIALQGFSNTAQAQDSPLADTQWKLVAIHSMDDQSYRPEETASYSLTFAGDGTTLIVSDCNRAQGSWSSEGPGQLTFGPLGSTRALCPPDSLDERYRSQFEWVRSYVLRNGALHLATMADGAIIEFSAVKAPPVVAVLAGNDLRITNPAEVQSEILDSLFGAYRVQKGLHATEAEVSAYLEKIDRTLAEEFGDDAEAIDEMSPEEQADVRAMREGMTRDMIERWKLNRALYEQYGGRVVYQQFGPEPLDAYRTFLKERQEAGEFTFLNDNYEELFWRYFEDETRHDFYLTKEAETAFEKPPWAQ